MSSVNKVILIGNLGKDVEVRTLQDGGKVANLSVATSEKWRDKSSGERKEKTEWHRVTIWNEKLVDVAEKYLRKGSKVYLEGQLETRKWTDKEGVEKYSTEVVLRPFRSTLTMLDNPHRDEDSGGGETDVEPEQTAAPRRQRNQDLDDEIPFVSRWAIL